MNNMKFHISPDADAFGSEATAEDGARGAAIIAEHCRAKWPDVDFSVGNGRNDWATQDELERAALIQQWINDHWAEWV